MISISGNAVSTDRLLSAYPEESVEASIIKILAGSSTVYNYGSMEELQFELNLRREIIAASKDLYRSGLQFATFRESRCNTLYWNRSPNGGFVLKQGANPSEAIEDIFKNGSKYATECATAMVIIYYKALLAIYPEPLFNKTFSKITLMNWHYLDRLLKEIGYMSKEKDYLPGDRRYFDNPDVNPLTPEWQGENVIDLGQGLYYGHGVGIHNADIIIRALNRNRSEGADESAFLLDSAGRPDFKKLFDVYSQDSRGR